MHHKKEKLSNSSILPLDELSAAIGALVGLLSAVDLPVAVEGAGVGQLLAADVAADHRLAVGTDDLLTGDRLPTWSRC